MTSSEREHKRIMRKLKKLRETERKRQIDVAEAIGVSRSHYANLEQGRGNVSLRMLIRVAHLYRRPLSELLR